MAVKIQLMEDIYIVPSSVVDILFPLRPSPTPVGLKLSATHAAIRHVCDLTSCYMLLRPCI